MRVTYSVVQRLDTGPLGANEGYERGGTIERQQVQPVAFFCFPEPGEFSGCLYLLCDRPLAGAEIVAVEIASIQIASIKVRVAPLCLNGLVLHCSHRSLDLHLGRRGALVIAHEQNVHLPPHPDGLFGRPHIQFPLQG